MIKILLIQVLIAIQLCNFKLILAETEFRANHRRNFEISECGSMSRQMVTTITTPEPTPTGSCTYTIRAFSPKICQLRVDMVSVTLAPPDTAQFPQCIDDIFKVGLPLCGALTGQHAYLTFPTNGARQIELNFQLGDRTNSDLPIPNWNLEVTQVYCARHKHKQQQQQQRSLDFAADDLRRNGTAALQGRVNHNMANPDDEEGVNGAVDKTQPAPPGCYQYYLRRTGIFESLNFGTGMGPYLGNMKYAICFKRFKGQASIQFTPSIFQMAFIEPDVLGIDAECFSNLANPAISEDHLFIPYATAQPIAGPLIRATRFCSTSIQNLEVTSTAPGPIVLHFNSDEVFDPDVPEIGFRIRYQII